MSREREDEEYEVQETEIIIPPTQPFYFDPERKLFVVGFSGSEKTFNPLEMDDLAIIDEKTFEDSKDTNINTPETLVRISFDDLVLMGSGRETLIDATIKQKKEILQKTKDVMINVYHEVDPSIPLSILKTRDSFTASIQDNGTFHLRTFGNCACLGALGYGGRVYFPKGYSYQLSIYFPVPLECHNLDTRAKILSIYAGAGTIGWLTRQMAQLKT